MLDIHLFGKFRKLAKNSAVTDDSKLEIEFHEGETIEELLNRLTIPIEEIGEIFVNHTTHEIDFVIPHDNSRIAIFPLGMHLLCGGQHLKGHGYITKQRINVAED